MSSQSEMKIFLSAVESATDKKASVKELINSGTPLLYNLMSYYYLRNCLEHGILVRDNSALIMIDSGAHSFQKGTRVNFDEYTHQYAAFIKEFDRPNVVGYFEMDVDNVLGYEKVLELRKILLDECGVPEKIIPVWHKNRGIQNFKDMCKEHSGRTVAITGFKNEDIKDDQYIVFLKEAKKHGCKVHCLGMTRKNILDRVPFDYVDSSSWAQSALYGRIAGKKVKKPTNREEWTKSFKAAYIEAMQMQKHYERKWHD